MTLMIELTPEEEAALQEQAQAVGLNASEYARQLLSSEGRTHFDDAEETALMAMLEDLKATGQSISQNLDTMNANLKEMVAMAQGIR